MIQRIDKGILVGLGVLLAACFVAPFHIQAAITGKVGTSTGALVGWWKLDEGTSTTATDFSGNGANGTLANAPTWTVGKRGSALQFNGTNQYVDTGNVGAYTNNFSVSAWIYKSVAFSAQSNWTILTKRNNNTAGWQFDASNTGKLIWRTFNGGSQFSATGNLTMTTGVWYHIVAVHTVGSVSMYINGVLDRTAAITDPAADATTFRIAYIGAGSGGSYWDGKEDDVRIYNQALTAADVAALYKSSAEVVTKTANNSLLAGWWKLDEGTSTTAGDTSGFGNKGTWSANASWTGGKRGGAATFSGSNYIALSSASTASFSGAQPFTVSAWAFGNPQNRGTVVSTASFTSGGYALAVGLNPPTANGSDVDFFIENSPSVNIGVLAPNNSFATSTWTHLVGVYDGVNIKVYVNGVLKNTQSLGGSTIGANPNPLRIGGATQGGWNNFTGNIDDVRVYNVALTDTQVAALYKENQSKINAPQNNRYTNGLVAYWTFNGPDIGSTITDVTGNGNGMYIRGVNATSSFLTIGKSGQALNFNLTNSYPYASGTPVGAISTNQITVAGWVYPYNTSSIMTLISSDRDCGGCGAYQGFGLQMYYGGTTLFRIWNNTGAGPFVASTATNPAANEWTFVAGTFDGTTIKIYENGVLKGSSGAVGNGTLGFPSTNDTKIGQLGCCSGTHTMNGKIDELRVYNRALSAVEIQQLYNLGK